MPMTWSPSVNNPPTTIQTAMTTQEIAPVSTTCAGSALHAARAGTES
ncbi:hypothetical protein IAE22_32480, partial [Bacillus sp. S34]|nr:hypothetical protein [Bacillus sp. S34]